MSGLTGHIDHLYEDPNLKLLDIIQIYRGIAKNSPELSFFEKIDGYNIYLSYSSKDKKARLLRNNSQISKGGITLEELRKEFVADRLQNGKKPVPAAIVKAYTDIIEFFEKTIEEFFGLKENVDLIFGRDANNDPEFFFNAEIVDPDAPNIIRYNRKMLIFHRLGNVKISAEKGIIEAVDNDEIKERFKELSKIFETNRSPGGISILQDKNAEMEIIDTDSLESELGVLRGDFNKYGLDVNDTIGKYFIAGIEKYLKDRKIVVNNEEKEFIVRSILAVGFGPKHLIKPKVNQFFSRPRKPEIKNFTNEDAAREIFSNIKAPIERAIFNCSSILLDRYKSVYISNSEQTSNDIINLINKAIENINSNGSSKQKSNLSRQLDKLRGSTVGFSNLIDNPVEGLVFQYNNHTYKITSSFGPVNQIMHMSKFEMQPLNENKHIEANGVRVLFAGAFKPPHRGHLEVIKNFIKLPSFSKENFVVEKVIVITGNKPRFSTNNTEFSIEQSIKLWKLYVKAAGLEDLVELRVTKRDNPVKDVYDYITNEENDVDKAQPGDVILLGVSKKDRGYYSNLAKYVKDKPWTVLFGEDYELPVVFKGEKKREQDILSDLSATEFRDAIVNNNIETINQFLPEEILSSNDYKKLAYNILGVKEEVERVEENKIFNLIEDKLKKQTNNTSKLNLNDLINRVSSIYNK